MGYTVSRGRGNRGATQAVLFSGALMAAYACAQESPRAVLEKCCAIAATDFTILNRGQALGRLIHLGDASDIAIMGAVRLTVPKEAYIDWYRQVENYKFSSMVKEAVQFHVPPQFEDAAGFVLDMNQLKLLKDCKPGKCGFKLSNEEIAQSQAELDWTAPNVSAKAEALAKSILLQHVARYMKLGDAALPKYNDKPEETDALATFRSLLDASPYVKAAFPELFARLSQYRGIEGSSNKDEIIYWSKEDYGFGLKALLNVMHATIYRASPSVTVIATRQIWASHYYEGSLGIIVLVDANPGTYLVYLNRSRIDLLRDAGFKRWLVKQFAPGAIRRTVVALKRQVEESRQALP